MNTLSKTISLSATLILLLAGCSSQQQVSDEGASQVASSSQAQQVAEDTCPSCNTPKIEPVVTAQPSKPAVVTAKPRKPVVVASGHTHPANRCTKSIRHNHPNGKRSHSHKYSCQGKSGGRSINIQALQRKLKAKGYYKGPIDGVINTGTRSALKRYQQRRK